MSKMAELAADVERANRLSEGPKFDDGGRAFPSSAPNEYSTDGTPIQRGYFEIGMLLRDHYAGQAMAAILSSGHLGDDENRPSFAYADSGKILWNGGSNHRHSIAKMAFEMADAMVAARSAKPEGK